MTIIISFRQADPNGTDQADYAHASTRGFYIHNICIHVYIIHIFIGRFGPRQYKGIVHTEYIYIQGDCIYIRHIYYIHIYIGRFCPRKYKGATAPALSQTGVWV
jgi:hypothetical protein